MPAILVILYFPNSFSVLKIYLLLFIKSTDYTAWVCCAQSQTIRENKKKKQNKTQDRWRYEATLSTLLFYILGSSLSCQTSSLLSAVEEQWLFTTVSKRALSNPLLFCLTDGCSITFFYLKLFKFNACIHIMQ